jgi:F0F1-type ATP synthase membrane subunit b/b'
MSTTLLILLSLGVIIILFILLSFLAKQMGKDMADTVMKIADAINETKKNNKGN